MLELVSCFSIAVVVMEGSDMAERSQKQENKIATRPHEAGCCSVRCRRLSIRSNCQRNERGSRQQQEPASNRKKSCLVLMLQPSPCGPWCQKDVSSVVADQRIAFDDDALIAKPLLNLSNVTFACLHARMRSATQLCGSKRPDRPTLD